MIGLRDQRWRLLAAAAAALLSFFVFTTVASAATVTTTWQTQPAAGTLGPGSTQDFVLRHVVSGGPTVAAVTIAIDYDFNSLGLPGQSGISGTPAIAGAGNSCNNNAVTSLLTCTIASGAANGTYDIAFSVTVPRRYLTNRTIVAALSGTDTLTPATLASNIFTFASGGPSEIRTKGPAESTSANDHVTRGGTADIPFTVQNKGTGVANDVIVEVSASASTLGIANVPSHPGCTVIDPAKQRCNIGSIPAGGETPVTVTVSGGDFGDGSVTVVKVSTDDAGTGGTSSETRFLQVTDGTTSETRLRAVDYTAYTTSGGAMTHTFVATNAGPNGLTNPRFELVPYSGIGDAVITGIVAPGAACGPDDDVGPDAWGCTFASLPVGGAVRFTVSATAPITSEQTDAGVSLRLLTNAYVPLQNGGGKNTLGTETRVNGPAADLDLAVVSPTNAQLTPGATMKLTVTNRGPSVAKSASVSGFLLNGSTWASGPVTCTGGRSYQCDLGDIAGGASVSVAVVIKGKAVGQKGGLRASVASTTFEVAPENDTVVASFMTDADLPARTVARLGKSTKLAKAKLLTAGTRVVVTCDRQCSASADLLIPAALAKKLGIAGKGKLIKVGGGKGSRDVAGKFTVTSKLLAKVKAKFKRQKKAIVLTRRVVITSTQGTGVTITQKVTITP